jgi:FkbM family methyltransferase
MDVNGFLGRVEIVSKAAYSEVAELNFSIYRNYKGSSGLWGSNEDAAIFRDQVDVISVPAVPLDVQLAGQKVDFLKIDAEGAEGHILLGAQRLIAENPGLQLLIEYAPRFIASCFESVDRFHDLLQRYGLEPHVVNHDATLTKMTFSELAASGIQHCDVVLRRKV